MQGVNSKRVNNSEPFTKTRMLDAVAGRARMKMRAAEGRKNPAESWPGHRGRPPLCVRHPPPLGLGAQVSEMGVAGGDSGARSAGIVVRASWI
jgi:hypothetical protein